MSVKQALSGAVSDQQPEVAHVIRFQHVTKTYGKGETCTEALKDVSLDVPNGSIFGVIGLSGAGKSTLIRCVNMLERPDQGTVEVSGQDITKLYGRELMVARRRIGMIFQHFNLLSSRTVRENIAFPLEITGVTRKEIDERVAGLLDLVGLQDKANAYPSQLSGGQKQRVGIARALANEPEVLLSDEATSALDPETTVQVLHLLRDINRRLGVTILLITHEMSVIQEICDHVAVLEQGTLVEVGSTLQVFTQPHSDMGRRLVQRHVGTQVPGYLPTSPSGSGHCMVRLTFTGQAAEQPVIANLTRNLAITPNILSGNISRIQGQALGVLVVELEGASDVIDAALTYLHNCGVQTEVLTNTAIA